MEVMNNFNKKIRTSNIQIFLKRFDFRLHHHQPNSNTLHSRYSKMNEYSKMNDERII